MQRTENEPDLLNAIITCYETWVFTYDPENQATMNAVEVNIVSNTITSTHGSLKFKATLVSLIRRVLMAEWVPSSQMVFTLRTTSAQRELL